MKTREEAQEQYYKFRAEIHAKHLNRETLESVLARTLVSLSEYSGDALFGIVNALTK